MNGGSSNEATTASTVSLTPAGQQYLSQARPWIRFLSILVFMGFGFVMLFGFLMAVGGIMLPLDDASDTAFGALAGMEFVVIGFFYFFLALLYLPPAVFLWQYASAIQSLERNPSSEALEGALKHQRSFWRYMGILCAVCLILGVLSTVLVLFLTILTI